MKMKKMIAAICILASGTLFGEPEPILHYQFDGITALVSDVSGSRLNASYQQQGAGEIALMPALGVSGRVDDYAYNGSSADAMGDASVGRAACRVSYTGNGLDDDYASFTICGWFKTEGSVPLSSNARLLTMVGTENVLLFDVPGNGLRFQIGKIFVESGADAYTAVNQWVFFAVTYDGTVSDEDNVKFWEGTKDNLKLVRRAKIDKEGEWNGLGPAGIISIGNRHGSAKGKNMNRPFDGYMDDFRIYASGRNEEGALSKADLDEIRLSVFAK